MLHVGMDINALCSEQITGVGVYILHLLKALNEEKISLEGFWNISRFKKGKFKNIEKHISIKNKPYLFLNLKPNTLFHGPDFRLPPYCPLPSCVTVHDLACFHQGFTSPLFAQAGQKKLHKMLAQNPKGIIVPSSFIAEEFQEKFPQYKGIVKTIYHGCDHIPLPQELSLTSLKTQPYLLWVGNVEKRKNLEEALCIFESIGKEIPHLEFIIAGKTGYLGDSIISSISSHSLSSRIVWLKYVSQENLLSLYQHATALLFLSHYEGFGFPVLEAMRRGCPVIISPRSSHGEIGGNVAFRHQNNQDTNHYIYRLIHENPFKEDIKKEIISYSSSFTWKKCAQETISLYHKILT